MIDRVTTHRSGFAVFALAGLCLGCAALILLIALDQPVGPENADLLARGVTSGVAYGVLGGAVALSMPRLVVGWLMLVIGVANAVSALCLALVDVALRADSASLEVSLSYWLASWVWVPGYVLVPTVLLLVLPNGRPPSPRWRGVLFGAYAVVTVTSLVWAVTPYDEQDLPVPAQYGHLRNPVGIEGVGPLLPVALLTLVVVTVLAVVSLFVRAHRAHGREREQVGWVLAGAVTTLLMFAVGLLLPAISYAVVAVGLVVLPVVIAWVTLRAKLWDIDTVLGRLLVNAGLGAAAVLLFAVGIRLAGDPDGGVLLLLVGLSVGAVQAVRGHLQRAVNRLLYDGPDEPAVVVARLGKQVGSATSPDEALTEVARVVATTLGADAVALRMADGREFAHGEGVHATRSLRLVHHGRTVGSLCLSDPPGGLGRRGEQLLVELAQHAAVAVHAVLVQSELQDSREHIVLSREEERRRLRNDLHDDLGPTLAATALQLEATSDLVASDPHRAVVGLQRAAASLRDSVSSVRRIVDDLRPTTLDELGLVGATREQADRLAGSVLQARVDACGDLTSLPAAAEVAAYRIVREAMTNVARHANARTMTVRFICGESLLTLEVADDGVGIRNGSAPGVGIESMRQRAAELGGGCEITLDGIGTLVRAWIPLQYRRVP